MKTLLIGTCLLFFALCPAAINSVAFPKHLIFPDMPRIKKIMGYHGTRYLVIKDERLVFVRNGHRIIAR